jgi:hypothetical protein
MFQLQQVPAPTADHEPAVVGAAMCVAFADGEAIGQLREAGAGVLELEPPVSLSDEDCYLVVPSDIGLELIDILRDADQEPPESRIIRTKRIAWSRSSADWL